MKTRLSLTLVACLTMAGAAVAQPPKDSKPATPAGQPQLPPGMSEADMKACMDAATPGPMHEHLAKCVGVWTGKNKFWMAPGMEPTVAECTSTITSIMDGRFIKNETAGEMPGMGPFTGFGITGYDNVSKKFQATWADNMGTGMMTGTGDLSADGKTLTYNFNFNCPMTKGPISVRQVEHYTGKDSMTLEMFGPDPKTGKEYKMMEISYTRKPGTGVTPTTKSDATK